MCGVFGYVGTEAEIGPDLLRALRTLEYRGYDSWGVAIADGDAIRVEKRTGRITSFELGLPPSDIGFGHTRWATHGGVTDLNAHPHLDCTGHLAVIHNGIVENHRELRDELTGRGHRFRSETDSEVVAHLLEERIGAGVGLVLAVREVFGRLTGLNAIVAMDVSNRELVATKSVSPLVAGLGDGATVIASDAIALMPHAGRLLYLEDGQLLRIGKDGLALYDRATLSPLPVNLADIDWTAVNTDLGPHPHYMAKEMAEQPDVLLRLARDGRDQIARLAEHAKAARRVVLTGCGTAANAALSGRYLLGDVAGLPVEVVPASEFRFLAGPVDADTLVVALSQSGETADVMEAMLAARGRGATLAALVNAPRSSLDRLVDLRVHLNAGPEQCVLATKSYTAMLAAQLLLAHAIVGDYDRGVESVAAAAAGIAEQLAEAPVARMRAIGRRVAEQDHMFVIGRGPAYSAALEAALKIKEVSYVHAEGFAGGELKHGVIALVEPGTPCLVFAPSDDTRADILSGAAELGSRGGWVIGVGSEPDPVFDDFLPVPDVGATAASIVGALVPQMIGYHAALARGNDPDRPRNLAKSVTVK